MHPAFVLHRRPYGDNSLLLELLTADAGRLPVIARGAASAKSRRRGLLQPFQSLLVDWVGKGAVKTLTKAEARSAVPQPAGKALLCGFYINELVMRLTAQSDPLPDLYRHYQQAMGRLSQAQNDELEQLLRQFELQLLEVLGYGLELRQEALAGEVIRPQGRYHYQTEKGFMRASNSQSGSVSGATLLALADAAPLDPQQRREARMLMRQVLGHYLGARPLKSRELFATLNTNEAKESKS